MEAGGMRYLGYILLGSVGGMLSGLIGTGGGLILVPLLVHLFRMDQHKAQGTVLALAIALVSIFAVWAYYRQGHVHVIAAGMLAIGFLVGCPLGALLAHRMSDQTLVR